MKVKSPDESANQENLLSLSIPTYILTFFSIKKMIIKIFWLKEAILGLEDAFTRAGAGAGAHAVPLRLPWHSLVGHSCEPGQWHSKDQAQKCCKSG